MHLLGVFLFHGRDLHDFRCINDEKYVPVKYIKTVLLFSPSATVLVRLRAFKGVYVAKFITQ
jgi:hypothetical protein